MSVGSPFEYVCRAATTYDQNGRFDPVAYALYLQRFVEPNIGIYVASSGSGAGQALTQDELASLYRVAVATVKGKITIGANIPEQFTSSLSIDQARIAAEANVDIINIYGPDGRHGFNPTDREYIRYFERILGAVEYPISLCPNPVIGYQPGPAVMAAIAKEFPHVQNVVLTGMNPDDTYFMELQELVADRVKIFVGANGSMNSLLMGAAGLAGNEANMIPKTLRRYLDAVSSRDFDGATAAYRQLRKFGTFASQQRPTHGVPRWQLMFLKVMDQPGCNGILPDPYLTPGAAEVEQFGRALLALGVDEIDEMAKSAKRS